MAQGFFFYTKIPSRENKKREIGFEGEGRKVVKRKKKEVEKKKRNPKPEK